ncbi:hypothetical protein TCON_0875 [Astathelohania contejeani]|uniref:Uncharacterized protein n=1 Tax=Astathelohania contejeani TaxID=164912 RepID=A0ABQ7I0I5_9MICR|nr:hypothetical protein TCON_0875 [Thelohania contejeani]
MQTGPLKEKTNLQSGKQVKNKQQTKSEKDTVLEYLKNFSEQTKDYSLRYDLTKCIEIIEGKENQEYKDLKMALEEVLEENEELFNEKAKLLLENEYLKSKL